MNRDGAFADFVVIPATNVWVQPDDLDPELGALFDPFGNATHTALSFPIAGEDVLITGAGPIGVMATAITRHVGARFIVVTDVSDFRLELARAAGADLAINPTTTTLREAMADLGMKEGFDIGLEMSGAPVAVDDMLATMNHGGRVAMLGLPHDPIPDRLEPGDHAHDHHQGHLRPRDVRHLVRHELDAADLGPPARSAALGDHPPASRRPVARGLRRRSGPGHCGKVILDWS